MTTNPESTSSARRGHARVRIALAGLIAAGVTASLADARLLLRDDPPRPAGAAPFTVHVVRLIAANRYAEAWTLLYPAHRGIVSRAAYARCESLSPIPGRLESVRVLSIKREEVPVAAQESTVPGAAVRLRLVIVGLSRVVVTHTFHAVRADRRWTWILPPERYLLYLRGRCPDAPPDYRGGPGSATSEPLAA